MAMLAGQRKNLEKYVQLEGSERRPAASSVLIGAADASEWLYGADPARCHARLA